MEESKILDPIIYELRKIREDLFNRHDNNPTKMLNEFKKQRSENEKLGFKYVSLKPKSILKKTGS